MESTILCVSVMVALNACFSTASLSSGQQGECLQAHNRVRALHADTPQLTWDDDLAAGAQSWAEYLLRENKLEHSGGTEGENLFVGSTSSGAYSCASAVEAWYNEIEYYSYATTDTKIVGKMIGHFTQVVWRSTTKVGVGIASSNSPGGVTTTFIVARYTPAGNFILRMFGEGPNEARLRVYSSMVAPLKTSDAPNLSGLTCLLGISSILSAMLVLSW